MLLIILIEVSEMYNPRSMISTQPAYNIYIDDTESSHKYSANLEPKWLTAKK